MNAHIVGAKSTHELAATFVLPAYLVEIDGAMDGEYTDAVRIVCAFHTTPNAPKDPPSAPVDRALKIHQLQPVHHTRGTEGGESMTNFLINWEQTAC